MPERSVGEEGRGAAPPLAQQTVLITGAGRGLGRALAEAFYHAGAAPVLLERDADAVDELERELPGATVYRVDLADAESTRRTIAAVRSVHPRVDTLIHNAGYLVPLAFATMTDEAWRRTFDVGVQAAYLLCRAFWAEWQRTGAAVVFVSSRSGVEGFVDEAPYCATKHALEGLMKALSLEGAADGILVHTVTPGRPMRTPMSERNYTAEMKQRWVDPLELAPAFLRLARREDRSLSGQRLDAWAMSQVVTSERSSPVRA